MLPLRGFLLRQSPYWSCKTELLYNCAKFEKMRLGIVKKAKYETALFNIVIFNDDEDLIVFSFEEFTRTYHDIMDSLKRMEEVLCEVRADPPRDPRREFEILEFYQEKIKSQLDPLLKFETQTTLETFAVQGEHQFKHQFKQSKNIRIIDKGDLQCLMGLNVGGK